MRRIVLLMILLFLGISTQAIAAESQSETSTPSIPINVSGLPAGLTDTISLTEKTPLYAKPDVKSKSWASLNPQDVKVVLVRDDDPSWIQIHTSWLGDMWVHMEYSKLGIIRPLDLELKLAALTPLYNYPNIGTASGAKLSPQPVHAIAEFFSPLGFYAIKIKTSWLGDQWIINPQITVSKDNSISFPNAISPDYGEYIQIKDLQVVKLNGNSYVKGQFILTQEAWSLGRFDPPPGFYNVAGNINFWNDSGDIIAKVPYQVNSRLGSSLKTSILLPVDRDLSAAVAATLESTLPFYFGLPLPPYLNQGDPKGILIRIQSVQYSGEYSVAKGWIGTALPGNYNYQLSLTFYGAGDYIIGHAKTHHTLKGPVVVDKNGLLDHGFIDNFEIIGDGDWTNYKRVSIVIDQATELPDGNLTDNEVKDILNELIPKAAAISGGMFNGSGNFKSDATKTIPGEDGYNLIVDKNIKSVADIKKAVEDVYTKDCAQKVFYNRYLTSDIDRPLYKDYEGKLYQDSKNGGHGWATKFLIDTAKVKSQKDHVVEVTLDTTVFDEPYGTAIIRIENVNGKWLMASGLDDYESIINGSVK